MDLLANEPRLLRAALDGRELTDDAEHVAAGQLGTGQYAYDRIEF